MERAFQSTEPFQDDYIEAPDPAYAPSTSAWRRYDTFYQLLVYSEPDAGAQYRGYGGPCAQMLQPCV